MSRMGEPCERPSSPPSPPPTPRTNEAGRALIKRFEGLRLDAYLCPAGVWTIGYGHTGDVRSGDRITEHQADAILDVDLDRFERAVGELTDGLELNENQFSALVSFAFNLGEAALTRSTLLRHLRAGDLERAADEFRKWVYAGGQVLPGLVKRRAAERELFLTRP